MADTAASPPANPFTYTGAYNEPTTDAAGYYLRARNYDPTTGRLTATDPAALPVGRPYISAYAYADNSPTRFTDPTGRTPDDPDDGKIHSFGQAASDFGEGLLEGVTMPFQFVGDLYHAFTGENGGAGGFIDKYLPVRPAYRLYRSAEMFRDQGCEELYDVYSQAAGELTKQIVATGIGGLRGWQRDAAMPVGGAGRYYGPTGETRFGAPYYTPLHPESSTRINPEGGRRNCGLCAIAGDELMAGKKSGPVAGAPMPLTRAEMSTRTGKPWIKMNGAAPLVNQMLRWGPGARAIVGAWLKKGTGHYYNVINNDGKIIFLDFQNGKPKPFAERYDEWYLMRMN
ncbi:RHS repeat-associated core domain-containing protein [Streptomyces sp. NPDC087849]|uniref:RHS repeat-associated core domain-containing protein n=1 Tax=Streptomyces sp. NPDC087849 TaxID=3365808 RepID=UPI003828394B